MTGRVLITDRDPGRRYIMCVSGCSDFMAAHKRHAGYLHCFPSPVGGIFRTWVAGSAEEHAKAGHQVGILCDIRPLEAL